MPEWQRRQKGQSRDGLPQIGGYESEVRSRLSNRQFPVCVGLVKTALPGLEALPLAYGGLKYPGKGTFKLAGQFIYLGIGNDEGRGE